MRCFFKSPFPSKLNEFKVKIDFHWVFLLANKDFNSPIIAPLKLTGLAGRDPPGGGRPPGGPPGGGGPPPGDPPGGGGPPPGGPPGGGGALLGAVGAAMTGAAPVPLVLSAETSLFIELIRDSNVEIL